MRLDAEETHLGTWRYSAAITAALVVAGGAAYAADKSAKAQKEAAKAGAKSSQSGTQTPYREDLIQGDINNIIALQRQQVAQGAPQVGPNGQLYYTGQGGAAGGGGGMQHAAQASTSAGAVPAGMRRNARGQLVQAGKNDPAWRAAQGGGGAAAPGGAPVPAPAKPASADDIFRQVASRGFDAGNTGTMDQARTAAGNILGAAGGGGPERTGFEGYNPILDRQAGRLEADADNRVGRDLLLGFLGENGRGGGANPNGTGGTGGNGQGGSGSTPGSVRASLSRQWFNPASSQITPAQTGVPDTMAVQSYFGDETRKIMDEQANSAELEALIRELNADVEKGQFRDLAQLDAAAQGTGRFGGDMWKGLSNDAREQAIQEMAKTAAGVRVGDRDARRNARLAALQGVNSRDQSLLGANVQREGIAAGERASSAASAASAAGQADQLALAQRGQDLSALNSLLGYETTGMGELTDIGQQLSGDRIATLGLTPSIEGVGLQGLGLALGGGQGMADLRGQDTSRAIAGQQANVARQGQNLQAGMFNAGQSQQQVNDYLRTVLGIGGMGGTSSGQGNQTTPYGGPSPTAAAIVAGLGAGASTYGAFQQNRPAAAQPSQPGVYGTGVGVW